MMGKYENKPLSVTIIGWLFIIIGGLMLTSGTMDIVSFDQYGSVKMANLTPVLKETPALFRAVLDSYQQNFMLVTLLQVLCSGFMLITGAFFLKLHSWARTILEGMSWLGLVYVVAVELFYIISWIGFISGPVIDGVSKAAVSFLLLGIVLGTAIWGALLIAVIRCLRGNTVKTALENAAHDDINLSYN